MTIGEVIQRIQSLYSKGVQSDDSRLEARHIYSKMVSSRSKLLSQKANKRQKINQWNYQPIPCVELIEAMPYECPCLPEIGCKILRTKYELPKPLVDLNNHLIEYVTSIDGQVVYSETDWESKQNQKGNRYTKNLPDYYVRGGYLYVTHKNGPKILTINGLFEDPIEVENFTTYCEEDCEDCDDCVGYMDKRFPLDNSLIEPLVDMAVKELLGVFAQGNEDITNNTRDNTIETTK